MKKRKFDVSLSPNLSKKELRNLFEDAIVSKLISSLTLHAEQKTIDWKAELAPLIEKEFENCMEITRSTILEYLTGSVTYLAESAKEIPESTLKKNIMMAVHNDLLQLNWLLEEDAEGYLSATFSRSAGWTHFKVEEELIAEAMKGAVLELVEVDDGFQVHCIKWPKVIVFVMDWRNAEALFRMRLGEYLYHVRHDSVFVRKVKS